MSGPLGAARALVIAYLLLLNAFTLAFFLAAFRAVWRRVRGRVYEDLSDVFQSPLAPAVSVIVAARGPAARVVDCVGNLLQMDYPRFEVIVVDDGSSEGALKALADAFKLAPPDPGEGGALPTRRVRGVHASRTHDGLTVIDKEAGGEADALNAGLNAAQHPYFCALDAGSILEPDGLLRLVREVLEAPARVVAVGGAVRAANGCRVEKGRIAEAGLSPGPLCVFQTVETFRDLLGAGTAFSQMDGLMTLSGAFALFERDPVVALGGYRADAAGEDMGLVARLHRGLREAGERGFAVRFVPDTMCWTEVPSSLAGLARRRRSRQRGLLDVLRLNKGIFLEPRYGALGSFAYPFLLVFEGWGVVIEALGYALFLWSLAGGNFAAGFVPAFLSVAVLGGAALSLAGILLGELAHRRYPRLRDLAVLALFACLEPLCYRPLSVFMRLWGVGEHLLGGKPS